MVNIDDITGYFPEHIRIARFKEYMLKEYLQYKILEYLFKSEYADLLTCLGGTCLRIVHGSQRFSEDMDFDHKDLNEKKFFEITKYLVDCLKAEGYPVMILDKEKDKKLKAFRRNVHFPELMFMQGISPHKEKRFLIKIEAQAHNITYKPVPEVISAFDVHAIIKTVPADLLLSMKICAMLTRKKGRDFFDFLFLVNKTKPHFGYLAQTKCITTPSQLKDSLIKRCEEIDFKLYSRDFHHLVFNPSDANKLIHFREILESLDFR